MPIEVSTVYTKKRLLGLNQFVARNKKFFWIIMAVCTCIVFACFLMVKSLGEPSVEIDICMIAVIALDALYVFGLILLPRLTVGKAKVLNCQLRYSFYEDHFQVHAILPFAEETSTMQYSALTKVGAGDGELYLFISKQQAYIVDLSEMPLEQQYLLRNLLQSNLDAKKLKWEI